jgi:hypothetical protein
MCRVGCLGLMPGVLNDAVGSKIDLNISLVDGNLIRIPKYCGNFFQRQSVRVGEVKPHDDTADATGDDEAEVLWI